jgi:hypothetical protein
MTSAGKRSSGLLGKSLFLALCLFLGTVAGLGQSQAAASDLTGTVVDPNGAVVPGATVTAKNLRNRHHPLDYSPMQTASIIWSPLHRANMRSAPKEPGLRK